MQSGQHVAGVAGARQARHVRPERDRTVEPRRRRDRCLVGGDDGTVGQRHAVAAEQFRGLLMGQPAAPGWLGEKAGDQFPGPVLAQAIQLGYVSGRGRPPGAVARGVAEGASGGLGVGVGRDEREPSSGPGSSRTASTWSSTAAATGTGSRAADTSGTRSPPAVVAVSASTRSTPGSAPTVPGAARTSRG